MDYTQKVKVKVPKSIEKAIKEKKVVALEVGCGIYIPEGAIGMDIRPLEGVDIVHNINHYPWPIPDDTFSRIAARHVLEHIPKDGSNPQIHLLAQLLVKKGLLKQKDIDDNVGETQIFSYLMRFMDECWRVMKVGGQLFMVLPYANSVGYLQDPSHCAPITENLFFYFSPEHQSRLWSIYKPRPWKIEMNTYSVNGNLEVILEKLPWTKELEKADYYK